MKLPCAIRFAGLLALISGLLAWGKPVEAQDEAKAVEGVEILTRGPIHEAFGQPILYDPVPGMTVAKKPPPSIQEIPPEYQVEAEGAVWISGYWAWSEERNDFIWVSGIWRVPPPGRQWVPGYWQPVQDGFQWISGFWASAEAREITYLPKPPESLEAGPSSQQPSANHYWVSGVWIWTGADYAWRPGYWLVYQPGWIWVPACYIWTPSGYVFVDGYWDYPLIRRGLLFAPVYIAATTYADVDFHYVPRYCIWSRILLYHFFARPRYCHYYFGDYYAADYLRVGIYPWFAFHSSRYGYDPVYAYYSTSYIRTDPAWSARIREEYRIRRTQESARPPATFEALQTLTTRRAKGEDVSQQLLVTEPVEQLAKTLTVQKEPLRLARLDKERRQQITESSKDILKTARQRVQTEASMSPKTPDRPIRRELPRSPIAAKVKERLPEQPKLPEAQPKPTITPPEVKRIRPEDRLEIPQPPTQPELPKPKPVEPPKPPVKEEEPRPKPKPPVRPPIKSEDVPKPRPAEPPKVMEPPKPRPVEPPKIVPPKPKPAEPPKVVEPPKPRPAESPKVVEPARPPVKIEEAKPKREEPSKEKEKKGKP